MSPIYRATSGLAFRKHPATCQQPLSPNTFVDKLCDALNKEKRKTAKKMRIKKLQFSPGRMNVEHFNATASIQRPNSLLSFKYIITIRVLWLYNFQISRTMNCINSLFASVSRMEGAERYSLEIILPFRWMTTFLYNWKRGATRTDRQIMKKRYAYRSLLMAGPGPGLTHK